MKRIINAIEKELASQEGTIYVQEYEIKELKRKLAEAEKTIAEQAHIIDDLKGETK